MKFEFDPAKSALNKQKHGIDFEEAQKIWAHDDWLELSVPSVVEPRYVVIGMIGEKYWTAVVTYRSDCIRLISVRRARDVEIACYEG
ncbi:MAG TPA: BrnT family toxin [Rhizomicrobium sp.]